MMETAKETPNADTLHRMSYSELKKIARKHGIKGNLKADKIIAALTSVNSNDFESFSTPAQEKINSSKKNKENKFDEDKMTPLITPRRGTYSVESPISVEDVTSTSVVIETSLDMSNVTVNRGSERKLRPRKVSFMTPMRTPRTPKNSNLKLRPKTPVASRTPLGKKVSFSSPVRHQKLKSLEKSMDTTFNSEISVSETYSDAVLSIADAAETNVALPVETEVSRRQDVTNLSRNDDTKSNSTESFVFQGKTSAKRKQVAMLNMAKLEATTSTKIKRAATPNMAKLEATASAKIKRAATPNFKRIHEKAFEKLESIDDYQKRKIVNSAKKINQRPNFKSKVTKAKSKIPAFSGIPFIPSVPSSAFSKLDHNSKKKELVISTGIQKTKVARESTPLRNKAKFDLKASLSRKLGYKPYKGPLKPLSESNTLNTSSATFFHNSKETVNKVVRANRLQTREALKGVRTNKRFELQMQNRKMQ